MNTFAYLRCTNPRHLKQTCIDLKKLLSEEPQTETIQINKEEILPDTLNNVSLKRSGRRRPTPLLNNGPGKPSRSKRQSTQNEQQQQNNSQKQHNQIDNKWNHNHWNTPNKPIKHDNTENKAAPKWKYNQEIFLATLNVRGMKEITKRKQIIIHYWYTLSTGG